MNGMAGLTAHGITGTVVPYLRAAGIEKRELPSILAGNCDADAGERRRPAVNTGDAGSP